MAPALGLVAAVAIVVLVLGIVGAFVVIVVANRAEADSTSRRPLTVYLFGVAFVTVWTALVGSATTVASLFQLVGSHPRVLGGAIHPIGDASARGAVLGGIVTLISIAVLVLHLRKGVELAMAENPSSPPALRTGQSYASAAAFVGVLVGAIALGVVVYSIFQIAGPGVFGGAGRILALRRLLDALYVVLASGAIVWTHLRLPVSPLRSRPASAQASSGPEQGPSES